MARWFRPVSRWGKRILSQPSAVASSTIRRIVASSTLLPSTGHEINSASTTQSWPSRPSETATLTP